MKNGCEAGEETTDVSNDYEKYAAAQAWLTDSANSSQQLLKLVVQCCLKDGTITLPFAYSVAQG